MILESGQNFGAFIFGRAADHDPAFLRGISFDPRFDVLRMGHAAGENQNLFPVLRQIDDLPAGVVHQIIIVHLGGDLVGEEIARADVKVRKIRFRFAVLAAERRKKITHDQFPDPYLVTNFVEQVFGLADQAAAQAVGRRCKSDQADVRIQFLFFGQQGLIHAVAVGRDQVAIMDQNSSGEIRVAPADLQVVYKRFAAVADIRYTRQPD